MRSRIAREPLVHFVVLGALLFAADAIRERVTGGDKNEDAPSATRPATATIVVPPDLRQTLAEDFELSENRAPMDKELDEAVKRWIDQEVLYREGLARGLDRDDPRVRQRIAQNMARILEREIVLPPPSDEELRAFFLAHQSRWAKSELIDLTNVFVQDEDGGSARAGQLLAQLQSGASPNGLGDTFSGGRRYRQRTLEDLASTFGPEAARGLAEQKEGTWAVRRSHHGWHVIRVDARRPAEAPDFEAVREEVRLAYDEKRRADALAAAVAELRKRWRAPGAP